MRRRPVALSKAQARMLRSIHDNQPLMYDDLYRVTRGQRETLEKLRAVSFAKVSECGVVTLLSQGQAWYNDNVRDESILSYA